MSMPAAVNYEGRYYLTTRQLAEVFDVDQKVIGRNFQRNMSRYEEGRHFILLTGDTLKQFKKDSEQEETLKFVSKLYLWTKEGALLLAKSCTSNKAWEALDAELADIFRV